MVLSIQEFTIKLVCLNSCCDSELKTRQLGRLAGSSPMPARWTGAEHHSKRYGKSHGFGLHPPWYRDLIQNLREKAEEYQQSVTDH